jgi:hypothetical protein
MQRTTQMPFILGFGAHAPVLAAAPQSLGADAC